MSETSFLKKNGLMIGLGFLSLILLILPFLAIPEDTESGFGVFLGRFHPMVVHFPIVLIMIPLLLESLRKWKNWEFIHKLMPLFLGLAIGSAAFSAFAGYLLYGSGEYGGEIIRNHLWAGVAVAIGTNFAFFVYQKRFNKIFLPLLILINLLLIYTGHLGGSLTHGEEYLTEHLPKFTASKAPIEAKPIEELNVFDDIVMAIFDAKCLSCHNERKSKGKFIMTSFEDLLAGEKAGNPCLILLHQLLENYLEESVFQGLI